MNTRRMRGGLLLGAVWTMMAATLSAQVSSPPATSVIPAGSLVQPEQLSKELQLHPREALVLQVGSRVLFEQAHIPGAEYAGPGSCAEGLELLRNRVSRLPRSQRIVIYCGCCPWDRCPNLGAAWNLLAELGFTRVRALYIANNFGADWVAKGFHADPSH